MRSSSDNQPRRPDGHGISGSPIPDTDCPSCQKPWCHTELKRAALHPVLKGSPYARRTKDLRFQVCKLCDRVYSEHFDTRERYTYFRFVGENALPLLAADSNFPSIVRWAATDSSEEGWMVEVLGSAVLKRRPQDLQPGVDAIMDRLRGGLATPSNMGAWRTAALFRLLARAVNRAAKDDLRPPGNKPVRRLEAGPKDLAWALEHVRNHKVEGLAVYGCSTYTVQRLAYDHLFRCGARERQGTLLVIDDLGPLWNAYDHIIMDESVEVPSRGYLQDCCWKSLEALRNEGACPGNEHVLYVPAGQWRDLFDRLDRVNRLAVAVRRLLQVCDSESLTLNTVLNDEQPNIRRLVNDGARVASPALARLAARLEALAVEGGPTIDTVTYNSLYPVVWQSEKAGACDYDPDVIAEALGLTDSR